MNRTVWSIVSAALLFAQASVLAACGGGTASLPTTGAWAPDSPYALHDSLGRAIPNTHVMLTREATALLAPTTSLNLSYHGGPVERTPKLHLIFWGFNGASDDPNNEAVYLRHFLGAVAGSKWLNTVRQYYSNPGRHHVGNPHNQLAGVWFDGASVPWHPTQGQVAAEAAKAAAHFNSYTEGTSFFIALPAGHDPKGFGAGGFCAFHSQTTSHGKTVIYEDFPYQTDAGASCGQSNVNPGPKGILDGVSIVAGHEVAETQTDPQLNAWYDSKGNELADKCAWANLQNTTFSTNVIFTTQPLWSNSIHGCTQAVPSTLVQSKLGSGFSNPAGVAVRGACNDNCYIVVADTLNGAVKQISPNGTTMTTITSGLSQPYGAAEQQNACKSYCITYIANTRSSEVLSDAAGTFVPLGSGFFDPFGVAVDRNGIVYVADTDDNVVKRIATNGTITTIGSGFAAPQGVAVDANGNVYVADTGNNAIKKIAPNDGAVTLVGHGFFAPAGVAVNPFCASKCIVYVADTDNNAVKMIAANGNITTVGSGYSGPMGVAVDGGGHVYVADTGNNTIWAIAP